MINKMDALLVVDMQNDFMPNGALPVTDGDKIIDEVNKLINNFEIVFATQDWHPSQHKSFASQHNNKQAFDVIDWQGSKQVLWPDHCIQNSVGADFHSNILSDRFETIFRKGTNPMIDSYSGFYDNNHLKSTGLAGALKEKEVNHVHICGLAADYCVHYSILDALESGFEVTLHQQATKPIDAKNYAAQLEQLSKEKRFHLI